MYYNLQMLERTDSRAVSSSIAEQIAKVVVDGKAHPEAAGGAHFAITLYDNPPVVEKRPYNETILRSVRIAQDRLDGLVIPFIVSSEERIFQMSVPSLLTVVTASPSEAEGLFRKYFQSQLDCMCRGVMNWDPKIENYGVDELGNVKLIDIGGLVLLRESLEQIAATSSLHFEPEESEDALLYLKMNEGVPRPLRSLFQGLQDEYELDTGTAIYSTLQKVSAEERQTRPRPVVWKPDFLS